MNNELLEALTLLEKEKNISKDTLLEAIEQSLIQACKNNFGKADNIKVSINPETCEFHVWAEKTVVEEVTDDVTEIALSKAKMIRSSYELGDTVNVEIHSKEFGRIATQNAKNVILQKIREEEHREPGGSGEPGDPAQHHSCLKSPQPHVPRPRLCGKRRRGPHRR